MGATSNDLVERDDLADRLFAAAQRRAAMHNMRLGDGADGDIRRFARTAAERILVEHPETGRAEKMFDAIQAFEKLVDEMTSAAGEIPGYRDAHPGIIGEQTLARALARLCPLFPIC